MSFFKKMLSKIGVGSANVETELFNTEFIPGQPVEGVVKIKGGSVEQDIDAIYFKIKSTFEDEIEVDTEKGEEEVDITRQALIMDFEISEPFTLQPDEELEFNLDFILPNDTPVTVGKTLTWVETGLDIKMAIDPGDKDYIKVLPHPLVSYVLDAVMDLGFKISEVVCEPAPSFFNIRLPFAQEFEFKPVAGDFVNKLDEIEIVFKPLPDSVEVFMEVDRKAKGLFGRFSEAMGTDETMIKFIVQEADLDDLTDKLNNLIEQYC